MSKASSNEQKSFTHLLIKSIVPLLSAELLTRISRLLAVVLLAVFLTPGEYGLAILIGVIHETFRVISRSGVSALIIRCEDKELHQVAANAATVNWLIAAAVAGVQYLAAPAIAQWYAKPELCEALRILCLCYLIYPFSMVRVTLLQRSEDMKTYALYSGAAIFFENSMTALLAFLGAGALSVVLAKVLASVVWVLGFSRPKVETIEMRFDRGHIVPLFKKAFVLQLGELAKSLRNGADVFIAAKIFGEDVFAAYAFAKNAAVGIGQSLNNAFLSALYPRFSNSINQNISGQALIRAYQGVAIIFLFCAAQSLAAPFYVPILFGDNWAHSSDLVSILCWAGGLYVFSDVTALWLRATKRLKEELFLYLSCLSFLLIGLGLSWQPSLASETASYTNTDSRDFAFQMLILLFFGAAASLYFVRKDIFQSLKAGGYYEKS